MVFPFTNRSFQPDRDIPDLSGKVILVTGGNIGLGKEAILELARHNPAKIYMGSRNKEKGEAAVAEIRDEVPKANIVFLPMDLSSFTSVQRAAHTFLAENDRLDILMNNAGIMATPPDLTEDGYELQFGTNYMGHALLTKLLLPVMEKTAQIPKADVRIINLSSEGHKWAPTSSFIFADLKTPQENISTLTRYAQSKLANLYHAEALAKRYPSITSVAVHPGVVGTNIAGNFRKGNPVLGWILENVVALALASPKTGAFTQVWAATARRLDVKSGGFYYPVGVPFSGAMRVDAEALGEELWVWTGKELDGFLGKKEDDLLCVLRSAEE